MRTSSHATSSKYTGWISSCSTVKQQLSHDQLRLCKGKHALKIGTAILAAVIAHQTPTFHQEQ
jgi:hypothetical protein